MVVICCDHPVCQDFILPPIDRPRAFVMKLVWLSFPKESVFPKTSWRGLTTRWFNFVEAWSFACSSWTWVWRQYSCAASTERRVCKRKATDSLRGRTTSRKGPCRCHQIFLDLRSTLAVRFSCFRWTLMFSVCKVRDRIWQWLTPTAWAAWASSTSNPLRSWPHQLRGRINKLVHKSWHSIREAGQILKFFRSHETDQTHQWLFKRNSEPEPMKKVLSTVDCIFGSLQGHWWWHGRDICSWWRRSVRQKRSVWRQPAEIPTKPRSTRESRLTGGIWLHDLVCMQFAIMTFEDKMKKTLRLGQSEEAHGRYFMSSCIVWFIW